MPTNPKLLISAEALRELRAHHALTQEALSLRTKEVDPRKKGISIQRIKQLEKGGATVFPRTANLLVKVFNVDVPYLLTRR